MYDEGDEETRRKGVQSSVREDKDSLEVGDICSRQHLR